MRDRCVCVCVCITTSFGVDANRLRSFCPVPTRRTETFCCLLKEVRLA